VDRRGLCTQIVYRRVTKSGPQSGQRPFDNRPCLLDPMSFDTSVVYMCTRVHDLVTSSAKAAVLSIATLQSSAFVHSLLAARSLTTSVVHCPSRKLTKIDSHLLRNTPQVGTVDSVFAFSSSQTPPRDSAVRPLHYRESTIDPSPPVCISTCPQQTICFSWCGEAISFLSQW